IWSRRPAWVRWVGNGVGWDVARGFSGWSGSISDLSSSGSVGLDGTFSVVWWVDDTNHAVLAVSAGSAVEPDWSSCVDIDGEDRHHVVVSTDRHVTRPEATRAVGSLSKWGARRVERGLSNRVVLGVKVSF